MPELTSTAEVERILRTTFDADATSECTRKLDAMEGRLRNRLNRPLLPELFTDEVVTVRADGTLRLQWAPVISVASITYDGTELTAYRWHRHGIVDRLSFTSLPAATSVEPPPVLATYTAGLDGANLPELADVVHMVTARHMAKVLDKAVGASTLQAEQVATSYDADGLTDDEWASIKRHRRRVV